MKINYKKILSFIFTLVIMGVVLLPHFAHAADTTGTTHSDSSVSIISSIAMPAVNGMITYVINFILSSTGYLLGISGTFLSVSMNLTTHIKDIYANVTAIQLVWVVVRDISSMFIIFGLLYFSILTIVGKGGKKWNELVKNIFLAGLLINFSLFFCRAAIDASNLISLQFYNAIAPNTSENFTVTQAFAKGGISDVFMNSLKIPKIYGNNSVFKQLDILGGIGIAGVAGIIMMLTATFSFFAASIAFSARIGILLFCMALSPLYFAGWIFPELEKEVSGRLMKVFKGQLIFMPVYLFLLYVALRVISDPMFMNVFNPPAGSGASNAAFGPTTIGVVIQYVIAIIFINAPLYVAISVSGTKGFGMNWAPQANTIAGFFGQHTFGRAASAASEKLSSSKFATTKFGSFISPIVDQRVLKNVSKSTFGGSKGGYESRYKDYVKKEEEFGKKIDITDEDKAAYVRENLSNFKNKTDNLITSRNAAIELSRSNAISTAKRKEYEKKAGELAGEVKAREDAMKKNKMIEYLETEAANKRKEDYAASIGGAGLPWTKAARKEAAKNLRKALKKPKGEKLLGELIKELEGDEKGGGGGKPDEGAKPDAGGGGGAPSGGGGGH